MRCFSATAVVAALVSVAAPAGAAKPASGEPLQFGYIDSLIGASAVPSLRQAFEAYIKDWNQRGGHHGQPIEVVFEEAATSDTGKQLAAHGLRLQPEDPSRPEPRNRQGDRAAVRGGRMAIFVQAVNTTSCVQEPSVM